MISQWDFFSIENMCTYGHYYINDNIEQCVLCQKVSNFKKTLNIKKLYRRSVNIDTEISAKSYFSKYSDFYGTGFHLLQRTVWSERNVEMLFKEYPRYI